MRALANIFACWFLIVFHAKAEGLDPLNRLVKHGQGTMQVYFWKLYDAEYFLPDKTLDLGRYPQALKITYLRDIAKEDLIQATKDQWQHIELQHANQQKWLEILGRIWPDIHKKDTLIIRVEKDGTSRFYYQKANKKHIELLGDIADKDFGESFLAIWLSPKTSRPHLREQLLGLGEIK